MSYAKMTIARAMAHIDENVLTLPAIQRKFVWDCDRIERLFDSLMRGYPIGTFLFWRIKEERRNDYAFYQFIKDYHARDSARNTRSARPRLGDRDLIGVLDGQQRLTSMYIALQGSYTLKRKYARGDRDDAYQRLELYLNILHAPQDPDEGDENGRQGASRYQFRFLTTEDAKAVTPDTLWFRVRDVLQCKKLAEIHAAYRDLERRYPVLTASPENPASELLTTLFDCLCKEENVNYFEVDADSLDEIVDIFVRVNSAGMQLSRTDLMFSTIVAHWEEGREHIEDLIGRINAKGNGFAFDTDFVMRSCLVLVDLPVLFKVASFRAENIDRITRDWSRIADAVSRAVELVASFGFSGESLTSQTVIIPIAYFAFHGGDLQASREVLRQFVLRSLLKTAFSSKTDQALALIRDHFRTCLARGRTLSLLDVVTMRLPENRTLHIGADEIERFLDASKGREAFPVLITLYMHLRFDRVQFHQDHLHPASHFTRTKLAKMGLEEQQIDRWIANRDRLPNLQFLEGTENQSKSAMPLAEWVERGWPDTAERFRRDNVIPADVSLAFVEFDRFFEARRAGLRQRLEQIFHV